MIIKNKHKIIFYYEVFHILAIIRLLFCYLCTGLKFANLR